MKERPILFKGPMVRAILDGRKTQTRRVINPQCEYSESVGFIQNKKAYGLGFTDAATIRNFAKWRCPYGQPGDRMWVRETWGLWDTQPKDGPERAQIFYRSTDGGNHHLRYQLWRPSIFMPRWASRITLEVVSVRVERLQEIEDYDCIKEGINLTTDDGSNLKDDFEKLWDSINGKKQPWASNPWVWRIEFRKIG